MASPPLQPRGPLPARVYWTRRLLLLGLALVLVIGFARILGGSSDGSDDGAKATTVGVTTSEPTETPTTEPVKRKRKKKKQTPTEPPLAEPTGPCENSDIVATPVVTEAQGGVDVPITLNLRTLESPACTWTVSPDTLTVSITSGNDAIWASRECPASIVPQEVVVRQAVDAPISVVWEDARRSDEGCTAQREWARLGYYHVEAAALGGEPTDVQFELVRPASAVITKTITPKPEPTTKGNGKNKGKKNKPADTDTAHTPGEQGSGNSEG
ncbi:hypothetical protein [Nocardioides allogilvus]|uniref:hypothetical protein n=1 Tax=Nocardioides allogilvus TaxID=2072017 RepID=UPI0013002C0A|nr:hypothetical protein [Nocardioides allogilvus]